MRPLKSRKAELASNTMSGEKSHAENAEFKMTELGPVPVDWEVKRLGDIGSFSKGAGISRAQANSGKIPAVRYGELYTTHHNYIKAFESFISDEVAKESTRLNYGDIVFACSGETKEEIGKCAAFLGNEVAYAGGDLIILSPKNGYDPKFLAFELNTPFCALQKAAAGQGDAVVHIRRESLEDLIVFLPPLAEQRRIAGALSDVDELISALGKLIEKKRNIKTGAMQQLLTGKTRLPGFGAKHTEFKQTELGPIPVDWEVKRLGDVSTLYNGYAFKSSSYVENGKYTVITIANVQDGSFSSDTANGINDLPRDIQRHQILKEGDILISMTGNVGRTCHVSRKNCLLNQRVGKFDSIKIDMSFLYIVVQDKNFISAMVDKGQGGAQANISKHDIEEYLFPLPTLAEQKAIAAVLSDMDAEIAALEADRAKYERIKSGMMQELLTGKTRLKERIGGSF